MKTFKQFIREAILDKDAPYSREELPQIKKADIASFVANMSSDNVKTILQKVPVSSLQPIQQDFNPDKADAIQKEIEAGKKFTPIIVSSDNYILDGHHRWVAHRNINGESLVDICKVDKPIEDLVKGEY